MFRAYRFSFVVFKRRKSRKVFELYLVLFFYFSVNQIHQVLSLRLNLKLRVCFTFDHVVAFVQDLALLLCFYFYTWLLNQLCELTLQQLLLTLRCVNYVVAQNF